MFASSSPPSTSQTSSAPPFASRLSAFAVPRRRLSKKAREDAAGDHLSLTRTTSSTMVDTHPAHAASSGRPMSQARASFFNNFSFRGRTNSNPSSTPTNSQQLSVKESSSSDEFGANKQRPLASNSTSSSSAHNGPQHPNQPSPPLRQQQQPPPQPQGPPQPFAEAGGQSRQLHPEIRSVVQLSNAHARKVYMSGELIKHVERLTDGKSVGKDEPWKRVWAQLGGTTLSVWDMAEIEEASRKGTEVPPTYINITDATIHVLGAVTMHGPTGAPIKYSNVVTLTTAGLNLLLFSCQNPQALIAWTAALRLSAYEKSRLEDIYTAHLLRMSLSENGAWKEPRSPLSNGRLEGWVTIRISGQTEWKRLWMCVQAGPGLADSAGGSDTMKSKNRMSTLFNRNAHEHSSSITSLNNVGTADGGPRPAYLSLFASQRPRDRKKAILTLSSVSQVFAVYPERPELISRSTLIKMEGYIGDEELAGEWKCREGWLLMMPEAEAGKLGSLEMLKWLVALHDAFGIGGRPSAYSWNPRDPSSLMFAYPVGPLRDNLFLDRELAESVDPREDRGSVVRQRFREILIDRMYGQERPQVSPQNGSASSPPLLPPIQPIAERQSEEDAEQRLPSRGLDNSSFQLPPLSFDSDSTPANQIPPLQRQGHSLSPVTERTEDASLHQSRGSTQDHVHSPPSASASMRVSTKPSTIAEEGGISDQRVEVESPVGSVPPPDSNQTITTSPQRTSTTKSEPAGPRSPLPPRFSQDSASMPLSTVSRADSNVQSSESEYSQPAAPLYGNQRSMSKTVVKPASPSREAEQVPPPSPPPSSANQRASLQQQYKAEEQQPPTPTSVMTHATTMTSPFSIHEGGRNSMGARPPPPPEKDMGRYRQGARESWEPHYEPKTQEESAYVFDEPGALYYVQQQQGGGPQAQQKLNEDESEYDRKSESSENSDLTNPASLRSANPTASVQQPSRLAQVQQGPVQTSPVSSPIARRSTPMGFELISGSVGIVPASVRSNSFDTQSASTSVKSGVDNQAQQQANLSVASGGARGLGRRPSGARELPSRAARSFVASESPRQAEAASLSSSPPPPLPPQQSAPPPRPTRHDMGAENDDGTVDALAALSFLEQQDEPSTAAPAKAASPTMRAMSPPGKSAMPPAPQIFEPEDRASTPPNAETKKQYRSSFAPSRQAEERKARTMAQQAMHDEAVHKPGRPNGKPKAKQRRENAWESSEEEEEEEEDDDEDGESDEDPRAASRGARSASSNNPSIVAPAARNPVYQQHMSGLSPSGSSVDVRDPQGQGRSRTLPQIPQRGRSPAGSENRFTEFDSSRERSGSRPQSQYPSQGPYPQQQYPQQQYPQQHPQQQQQQPQQLLPQPHPGPANMRQSMWSTVLDVNRNTGVPQPPMNNSRDTFVQMESPAATMTKAFTPQGLLSAGLQDKQDRSAKRQEEMARESGASLINVPNKPPPPQVGLLGAITAHERDKKREGGIGATLTEREREKRLAEDRQRRIDDLQRQQLEQQQAMVAQFGGMYGQGLTPQMTGVNPMGGGFGFNPMQSMYFNPMMMNPQHMFAAQQAAAAYQQAMYAMSTAGSQIGENTGNNNNSGVTPGAGGGPSGSPSLRPNSAGGLPQQMMGGFDPRMSMMGMPMMGMGMGMGGMPMQMPLGMQMTGQSGMPMGGMDPRMSMSPNTFDQMSQWGGMMGSTGPLATPPGGSGPSSQHVTPLSESPAEMTASGPSRTGTGEEGAR